ncbi:MAG TPA: lipocalin-like domain-containing protein, partial [Candidatus Thermoplasmatota archaeon]|nr:lipocalin-like domain-containing protein [Candidatus Thermoplasmatota archaeon]
PQRRWTRRKSYAVIMVLILVVSSGWYLATHEGSSKNLKIQTPVENIDNTIPQPQDVPTPPGSSRTIDSGRHVLLPSDEGVHKFSGREWWYFNVFFNDIYSDLYNYSLIVSFNRMKWNDIRFLKPDNLFIFLYDPNGTNYNFATENKKRGTLQANTPGVDVTFESSWAKGTYPSWQVHAVNAAQGFSVDLEYTADFLPVWVEGRSANLPIAKYVAGDYYVPRCRVNGTITWNGRRYNVSGMGYHDHVWERNVPRFITKGWDWANIHFDNGWEMYISKFIIRAPRNPYSGAIILSPNNRNLTEFNKFTITFTESASPQGLPFMTYPKKFHLEAQRDDMVLKLDVDIYNICQNVFKLARTGLFEGPCHVTGTFSWAGYTVDLQGYGLTEITRVKYFLGLPETVT